MKLLIITIFSSMFVATYSQMYTDKYDTINLDEVLNNRRLLMAYVNCVMNKGKCTPEGKELKSHIIEALQNGCSKCTNAQQEGMRRVIKHLITYEQESWQQLVALYDPNKVYTHKYENELKAL